MKSAEECRGRRDEQVDDAVSCRWMMPVASGLMFSGNLGRLSLGILPGLQLSRATTCSLSELASCRCRG